MKTTTTDEGGHQDDPEMPPLTTKIESEEDYSSSDLLGTTEHTWTTRDSLTPIMTTTLGRSLASAMVTQMTSMSATTGDRTTIV